MAKKNNNRNEDKKNYKACPDLVKDIETSKEKTCRDYLTPKEKDKLNCMISQTGMPEAEILADAFSQYLKKRNPGQREVARYRIILQEDLRKIIDKIPPDMEELIEMLEEYCAKEEMLCQH